MREIRRLAAENNDRPVGKERFEALTALTEAAWRGRYWARWSDAVRDAGFEANAWQAKVHNDDALVKMLAIVTRDLGFFPTGADLRLRRQTDSALPNDKVFFNRLGGRLEQLSKVRAFSEADPSFADVSAICAVSTVRARRASKPTHSEIVTTGVVYLIQMGEFHKIGKSNDPGRRMYELGIRLPEKHDVVHIIETDDPSGIESYWHRRFAAHRANGEWFRLSSSDVAAFVRRQYM